tara:strand:+ start:329 stop:448 length:120 start_codon:yes stop_codon:yes gene_type:complete
VKENQPNVCNQVQTEDALVKDIISTHPPPELEAAPSISI